MKKSNLRLEAFHPDIAFDPEHGLLTWTPTAEVTDQLVRIRATDSQRRLYRTGIPDFGCAGHTKFCATIVSQPRTTARLGLPYVYAVQVEQGDSDRLTWLIENGPDGMAINEQGVLTWNSVPPSLTSYPVSIRVEDGRGGFDTQSFELKSSRRIRIRHR
ncbi:MAG: hypothetical protein R3C03_17720 [Pirellulaceae bacterium]